MTDILNFKFDKNASSIIKVIGVGGGGSNAVNHMFRLGIHEVDFIICNTDAQALESSPVNERIQLGASLTEGRGAGNKPEVGKEAAMESIDQIRQILGKTTRMVFITAGMGGGTGTGGAPVIAQMCRDIGYLTVGVVTIPFRNEGRRRIRQAIEGITELESFTDSLLVINNERIKDMYGDFPISQAFAKADDVLATAVKGIAEIITVPGYINVDFADVETVMRNSGVAVMGTGIAEGDERALEAVERALTSPLLNNNDIRGARNVLLNINSGDIEVTMDEIASITDYIQTKAGFEADIIWGNGVDPSLGNQISVTVIATGFSTSSIPEILLAKKQEKEVFTLGSKPENNRQNTADYPPSKETRVPEQKVFQGEKKSQAESEIRKQKRNEELFESLYPSTAKNRGVTLGNNDFSTMTDEEIDELEKIPAYLRKQMDIRNPNLKRKIQASDIVVSVDEKKGVYFKENTYIHKKVD